MKNNSNKSFPIPRAQGRCDILKPIKHKQLASENKVLVYVQYFSEV